MHCGSQDDFSSHFMYFGSVDLVPCGFGAKRGLDLSHHIRWSMQQIHPHASMQAALETKLDAVAKLVDSKNQAELDEIRADRLKI